MITTVTYRTTYWERNDTNELLNFYILDSLAQSNATVVESLRNWINDSEMGPLLCELRHKYLRVLQYLTDFVHMVYKTSSTDPKSEHQVSSYSLFAWH